MFNSLLTSVDPGKHIKALGLRSYVFAATSVCGFYVVCTFLVVLSTLYAGNTPATTCAPINMTTALKEFTNNECWLAFTARTNWNISTDSKMPKMNFKGLFGAMFIQVVITQTLKK
jgi:hypothetical protein